MIFLRLKSLALLIIALAALQGCSSTPTRTPARLPAPADGSAGNVPQARPASPGPLVARPKTPGGYYLDDGPGANPPDVDAIPDAVPKLEPLASRANRPYSVFGIQFIPLTQLKPYRERGFASWYGRKFHGQTTSNGEKYDMYAMTAAHPTFPLPSYARVTNPRNGKSVIVRVNDRGPFLNNRIIDLSYTAAAKLGYVQAGSAEVEVSLIDDPEKFTLAGAAGNAGVAAIAANSPPAKPATIPSDAPSEVRSDGPVNGPKPQSATEAVAVPEAGLVLTRETLIVSQPGFNTPGLYLQLGAFAARETGEATRQRLEQQFPWLVSELASKSGYQLRPEAGLFKLHVGPFKTRAEALSSIERLKTESGLQAFVVTR